MQVRQDAVVSMTRGKDINRAPAGRAGEVIGHLGFGCRDRHTCFAKPLHISGNTLNAKPEQCVECGYL